MRKLRMFFMRLCQDKREYKNYKIIYIACHGDVGTLSLEGKDGEINLEELAEMSGSFFEGRIVHFSSCSTLADPEAVEKFKKNTGAKLVSV